MKTRCLVTALAVLAVASSAFASETFSWTGSYQGHVICARVADGMPLNFRRSISADVLQDGDELLFVIGSDFDMGDRVGNSLYRGLLHRGAAGEADSGFLEACRTSFPYKELVRIFPMAPTQYPFGVVADTIFVSDMMPGAEGNLIVESCRWSLDRVSDQSPEIEGCGGATSEGSPQ